MDRPHLHPIAAAIAAASPSASTAEHNSPAFAWESASQHGTGSLPLRGVSIMQFEPSGNGAPAALSSPHQQMTQDYVRMLQQQQQQQQYQQYNQSQSNMPPPSVSSASSSSIASTNYVALSLPSHAGIAAPILATTQPTPQLAVPTLSSIPSPPSTSSVLTSPLDSDVWLLMLHQLFHARSNDGWARKMSHELYEHLCAEARLANSVASNSNRSAFAPGKDWTGANRMRSIEEVMAQHAQFPTDYTKQIVNMTTNSAASSAAATSSASSSHSLWHDGRFALLPSLRRSRRDISLRSSHNILYALRHREIGTSSSRLVRERTLSKADSTMKNELWLRHLRKIKITTGHRDAIYCITQDRTGQRIYTGSDDNTVKVWSAQTGQLLATCRGHAAVITEISVSPDNTLVVSVSNDTRIRVWDINGTPLAVLLGHTNDVMRGVFNPDFTEGNKFLLSASLDGTARVWNCSNLSEPPTIITCKPKPWPTGVEYLPYDLEGLCNNGGEVDSLPQTIPNPEFMCLAFHPNGSEFVVGHNDHNARVYDMKRRCVFAILSGHKGEVESVSYSASGMYILTIAGDGEAFIWSRITIGAIRTAALKVGQSLPRHPPVQAGSVWNHRPEAPLRQAAMYPGLMRAVREAGGNAQSATPPPAPAATPSSTTTDLLPPEQSGLPTHRYIITSRLTVNASTATRASQQHTATSATTAAGSAAAPVASVTTSILSGIWSHFDTHIYGADSNHAVLVWPAPSNIRSGPEEQNPFMAREVEERERQAIIASMMKKQRVTTGRAKRSLLPDEHAMPPPFAPLTLLSCFRRSSISPLLCFNIHTEKVPIIVKHPCLRDLFMSAGVDGRVVWYDTAQGRVLKCFKHVYQGIESPFVDAALPPVGSGSAMTGPIVLTNELGQMYWYGCGLDSTPYIIAPEQQFFQRDYVAVQRDAYEQVLDIDTGAPPHLSPGAKTLCDANGVVYTHAMPLPDLMRPDEARVPVLLDAAASNEHHDERIRNYSPHTPHPRYHVASRTGLHPSQTIEAVKRENEVIEIDSQLWRAPQSVLTRFDRITEYTVPLGQLIRDQRESDVKYARLQYDIRVAVQQQRQLLQIARDAAPPSSDESGALLFPANWTPLSSLPLPIRTPLLRQSSTSANSSDAEDGNEEDTRRYRGLYYDANGVAMRRDRRTHSMSISRPNRASSFSRDATSNDRGHTSPARVSTRPQRRTSSASNNIHTLSSTVGSRRAPITLTNDDDNYHDDDYAPDAAAAASNTEGTRTQRAQRRAFQRFEDINQLDANDEVPATAPVTTTRTRTRAAATAAGEDDEAEEEKKVESEASPEHSEYSDGADDDEALQNEPTSRTSGRSRRKPQRSRRRNVIDDDDEEEEEIMTDDMGSSSESAQSDGDSEGSYRHRSSRSRAPTSAAASRKRSRSESTGPASGSGHATRSSQRSAKRTKHNADAGDEDWHGGEREDEMTLVKSAYAARELRAKKRAQAAAAPPPQRQPTRKRPTYAEAEEDEFNETYEPKSSAAAAAASNVGASDRDSVNTDPSSELDPRLFQVGNWLQRPLAQQYNSSYVPQLGDRVMYVRRGHEAQVRKLSERMSPASLRGAVPHVPEMVRCIVGRIEYMWSDDTSNKKLLRSPNRLYQLPRDAHGKIIASLRVMQPPSVFARITLVPIEDFHLVTNVNAPGSIKKKQQKQEMQINAMKDEEPQTKVEEMTPPTEPQYNFTSLPVPYRHFVIVHADAARIRLRGVHDEGDAATSSSQSDMTKDESLEPEPYVRPKRSVRSAIEPIEPEPYVRPKRSLRSAAAAVVPDDEYEPNSPTSSASSVYVPEPEPDVVTASIMTSNSNGLTLKLPSRQSLRAAISASLHDVEPSSSSTLTLPHEMSHSILPQGNKRTRTRIIMNNRPSKGAPSLTQGSRAMSLRLTNASSSQQDSVVPSRSSQRQRVPKREHDTLSNMQRDAAAAQDALMSTTASSVVFPPSSFTIDLFEPLGADYLILLSRLDASRALHHPDTWMTGEQFQMKYSDTPEWSLGFICSNIPPSAQQEQALTITTRHQKATAATTTQQGGSGAGSSQWETLTVSWLKEDEIDATLEEEQAARSNSLVSIDPYAHLSDSERHALRRRDLLARLVAEGQTEAVSAWEIDPLGRSVRTIDDLDALQLAMEEIEQKKAASNAAASSSSSKSTSSSSSSIPDLLSLRSPSAFIDTTEYLPSSVTRTLLSIIRSVLPSPDFETPVDRQQYPDYAHVVPYAMDLGTITRRLEYRYYRTIAAVAHDVSSLCRAATLFNDPGRPIVEAACEIESIILRKIYTTFTATSNEIDSASAYPILIQTDQEIDWQAEVVTEEDDAEEDGDDDKVEVVPHKTKQQRHLHEEEDDDDDKKPLAPSQLTQSQSQPQRQPQSTFSLDATMNDERKDNQPQPMEIDDDQPRPIKQNEEATNNSIWA